MNHSLNCTVFNRGAPVSKSSWNLGETESDRHTFLGELEIGKELYIITNPQFIWINTNVPVDLVTTFNDDTPDMSLSGVMTYVNSFTKDCQVRIVTRDTTDMQLTHVEMHCITVSQNTRKALNEEFE